MHKVRITRYKHAILRCKLTIVRKKETELWEKKSQLPFLFFILWQKQASIAFKMFPYYHCLFDFLTTANIKLKYVADLFQAGLNSEHIFPYQNGCFSLEIKRFPWNICVWLNHHFSQKTFFHLKKKRCVRRNMFNHYSTIYLRNAGQLCGNYIWNREMYTAFLFSKIIYNFY